MFRVRSTAVRVPLNVAREGVQQGFRRSETARRATRSMFYRFWLRAKFRSERGIEKDHENVTFVCVHLKFHATLDMGLVARQHLLTKRSHGTTHFQVYEKRSHKTRGPCSFCGVTVRNFRSVEYMVWGLGVGLLGFNAKLGVG